jgi:hypothetical protein
VIWLSAGFTPLLDRWLQPFVRAVRSIWLKPDLKPRKFRAHAFHQLKLVAEGEPAEAG